MRKFYRILRELSLLFYILFLYQIWHLCKYGGVISHIPMLLLGIGGVSICFGTWFAFREEVEYEEKTARERWISMIEIIFTVFATCYFAVCVILTAIPYNGALSWKIDEIMSKKAVTFVHTNFYEDGVEGIIKDLNDALDIPNKLYITDGFEMSFDENGEIETVQTFLYGKNDEGENRGYLVEYDKTKNEKIIVWKQERSDLDYNDDMSLEPMLQILSEADCWKRVSEWSDKYKTEKYEIVYYGKRSFFNDEGLQIVSGSSVVSQLRNGGAVHGFEVSLHMPDVQEVTPVRYMAEPEYISQERINAEKREEFVKETIESEGWTVDQSSGTMSFFLDENHGWSLAVVDAAAGSRFYKMLRTQDAGYSWEEVNPNPFNGNGGAAEGLVFFDENFGAAGLTGASQSSSVIYITRDGGVTLEELQLPMDTVTALPPHAEEYGFTIEDYDYYDMPRKEGEILTIQVMTSAGENEAISFVSTDNGVSWKYAG